MSDLKSRMAHARDLPDRPRRDRFVGPPSIGALLRSRAVERPDAPLIVWRDPATGGLQEVAYGWFRDRVDLMARTITGVMRLVPGDRAALIAHNHPDAVALSFAAWRAGVTVVPVDVGWDDAMLRAVVKDSACRAAFVLPEHVDRAEGLRARLKRVEHWVRLGSGNPPTGWRSLSRDMEKAWQARPPEDVRPDQEALVVYTGGAVGDLKGVVLDHYNLLSDAHAIVATNALDEKARGMCVLPIHRVDALVMSLVANLYAGGSTVLCHAFSAQDFWGAVRDAGVTWVPTTPAMLESLLAADEKVKAEDVPTLRHVVCWAGSLTTDLARRWEGRFGVPLLTAYGTPETTCCATSMPCDLSARQRARWLTDGDFPSVGPACAVNVVAVHDADGHEVADGEPGEIVVRGHNVMAGYNGRPEANEAAFGHGWLRTGDQGLVRRDTDGRAFFYITGRSSEVKP